MDHQPASVRFPQVVEIDLGAGVARLDGAVIRDVGRLVVSCGPASLRVQIVRPGGDRPRPQAGDGGK